MGSKNLTLNLQAPSPGFSISPQGPYRGWGRETGSPIEENFTPNFHSPFWTLRHTSGSFKSQSPTLLRGSKD